MICKEELRFGNYVYSRSKQDPICINSFDTFKRVSRLSATHAYIPLTEEWLLKFGFEIKSKYSYTNYALPNGWGVSMWTDEVPIAGFEEKGVCYWGEDYIPVRYVHDLQNLYHSLTGKELELFTLQRIVVKIYLAVLMQSVH